MNDRAGISLLLEGLRPVDPRFLKAYETEMAEEAIPEIVRNVARRQRLAAESRTRWLEINVELLEALKAMSDPQPTIELHQEREQPKAKPASVRAAAAPTDPAAPAPPEIVTTITLKPGVKITIEYPSQ
jgi:hypothetical protein